MGFPQNKLRDVLYAHQPSELDALSFNKVCKKGTEKIVWGAFNKGGKQNQS